jgi:hypothetical protein
MKKTALFSSACLLAGGLVLPFQTQARETDASVFQQYRSQMTEINNRQNQRAEALGAQFEKKLADYYLGKGKYPTELSRQFSKISKDRGAELERAQADLGKARDQLNGAKREVPKVAVEGGRLPAGAAPAQAPPADTRESYVLDGSSVQKEIEFHGDGAATGEPATSGGSGVQEIQFGK